MIPPAQAPIPNPETLEESTEVEEVDGVLQCTSVWLAICFSSQYFGPIFDHT